MTIVGLKEDRLIFQNKNIIVMEVLIVRVFLSTETAVYYLQRA